MAYTPLTFFKNWKDSGLKEASKIEIGRNLVGKDLDDRLDKPLYEKTTLKDVVVGGSKIIAGNLVMVAGATMSVSLLGLAAYSGMSDSGGENHATAALVMSPLGFLVGGSVWNTGASIKESGYSKIRGTPKGLYSSVSEGENSPLDEYYFSDTQE